MTQKIKGPVGRPSTIEAPRETILSEAAKLFAAMGYENASLQDVAKAVGISKAAVYHYFTSKQQIYDEIVVHMLQQLDEFVRDRIKAEGNDRERLKTFMISHATFMEQNYTQFVTLLHGHSGTAISRSPKEVAARDSYEAMLRDLLTAGAENGALTFDDIASASRAILSMLNWMSRWFHPEGPRRAADFATDYFNLLYHGMKGPSHG